MSNGLLYVAALVYALVFLGDWRRQQRAKYEALGDGDVWNEGDDPR